MNKLLSTLIAASGFVALLLLALAGPLYRLEWLGLGMAFGMMRWAFFIGVASVVLIIGYSLWRRPGGRFGSVLAFSALAGLVAAYIPLSQLQAARSVPPIHDISTDLENPPEFVETLPLRQDAPNPPEYPGEETAEQQREAYPDLAPLILKYPLERVHEAAEQLVEQLGWDLVASVLDDNRARIEATDTTRWFGFKDDVVIRLIQVDEGTRLDMRSKSRVGGSDIGTNAERIREFTRALPGALSSE
ncbi:DUF1499 domain-containing protein [Marinimicrobium sp. ABcell2]|uniref:DUF1499 domain-containing protein n=1 Tax=Marinimicrobium sp. ABcell2 TaxID=3069751 RepID=UPI0027B381E1|nr:DUF1499 domain-containing protein [Marinimicrobium sp. ABcell2]MDQ2075754.1 DUF1499 domain-containing protein [Marinimicrobium sp. ABcell2]